MQEQINRIRNVNYSDIDSKVQINVGITNELQCSITKLTQLQCFLKNQINSIEDQGQKQIIVCSSPVILKMNLDNSRQQINKCNCCKRFKEIQEKMKKMKKSLKAIKQNIVHELSDFVNDLKDIFNDNFVYLLNLTTRKANQTLKYKMQVQNMKMQIDDLKYKNMNLQLKIQQWQSAKKRRQQILQKNGDQQSVMSIYTITQGQQTSRQMFVCLNNASTQLSKNMKQISSVQNQKYYFSQYTQQNKQMESDSDTPPLPMPLRKQSLVVRQMNKYEQNYSKQRLNEKQFLLSSKQYSTTVKNSPAKLKITWNQDTSPISHAKQNQILKNKGLMNKNLRRSTKKLKLFSLM